MTKTKHRQLELPVLTNVNGKPTRIVSEERVSGSVTGPVHDREGFHKPATADDQSIYKAISDNYFGGTAKQA